jgi:hypothetical protein
MEMSGYEGGKEVGERDGVEEILGTASPGLGRDKEKEKELEEDEPAGDAAPYRLHTNKQI